MGILSFSYLHSQLPSTQWAGNQFGGWVVVVGERVVNQKGLIFRVEKF